MYNSKSHLCQLQMQNFCLFPLCARRLRAHTICQNRSAKSAVSKQNTPLLPKWKRAAFNQTGHSSTGGLVWLGTSLSLAELTRSIWKPAGLASQFNAPNHCHFSVTPLKQILQSRYLHLHMHLRVALLTFSESWSLPSSDKTLPVTTLNFDSFF